MNLKSLYSKFIMSICESKYADADKTLDTILTEKVKAKVKKAVKEKECCDKCDKDCKCGKSKKKVVKETAKKTYNASLLKEALTEKGVATIQKWISDLGVEEAARKTIDSILTRIVGIGSDDLPDTSTFANGYEAVVEAYEQGDFQGGYQIARDTAKEMVEEEGGEGIFESVEDKPEKIVKLVVLFSDMLASPVTAATKEYRKYFDDEKEGFIFADHDETGDTITGKWPLNTEDRKRNLRALLFGARETGQLPSHLKSVILPDGKEFTIDQTKNEGGQEIFESTDLDKPNMVSIKSLKKGEYFKRKPDSKKVYVKGDWNPAANKYNCSLADDMNQEFNVKKDSLVFTEFEY